MLIKFIKSLVKRIKRATINLPKFPNGTKFSIRYRFRRLFTPNKYIPAYIKSPQKVYHYLSNDPLDERVLEEILGSLSHLFFPLISKDVAEKLLNGGYLLDIGAFNGGWGVEMLARFTNCRTIFFEPNPEKCKNIEKTLMKSNLGSRSRIIDAGIARSTGDAWLIKSEDGAWGDWLEYSKPTKEESIKVKTITLIDALEDKVEPVIVKCNAEGGEFEFIRQLIKTKIRPQIMILMIHPEMGNIDDLWESLIKVNYKIKKVLDHPKRPVWHAKWAGAEND